MPIVFQGRPAALNRVVFAVIGRVVDEVYPQSGGLGKLRHPLDELGPVTSHGRTAIEVNRQGSDLRIAVPLLGPPLSETIDDEIAGFRRLPEINGQLTGVDVENAEGH